MRKESLGYMGFLGLLGLLYIPTRNFGFFGFFGFFAGFALFRSTKAATADERLAINWNSSARNAFILMSVLALALQVFAYLENPTGNSLVILAILLAGGHTAFGASMVYYDRRGT
jgi:hypothetical protein